MTYALTVAGFDGSAGAGFVADIKTMAHFGVYGQAVCTALTQQNEDEFVAPGWVIWDRIEAQLETLFKKHKFKYVKIGLVEKARTAMNLRTRLSCGTRLQVHRLGSTLCARPTSLFP